MIYYKAIRNKLFGFIERSEAFAECGEELRGCGQLEDYHVSLHFRAEGSGDQAVDPE